MAQVIEIDGRKLAIGLEWSIQPSKATTKEALSAVEGRALFVSRVVDDGIILGISDSPETKGCLAAAMAIASTNQDAVIFHEFDDGTVWTCAILYGTPLPNTDQVLSLEDARAKFGELMGSQQNAVIIGTINGAAMSVSEAVAQTPARLIKRMTVQASGPNIMMFLLVAVLLAVIGGAFIGFSVWKKREAEKAEQAAIEASIAQQQQLAERQRQTALKDAASKVEDQRREMVAGVQARDQYIAWRQQIDATPLRHEGYVLDDVKCDALGEGVSTCTLNWRSLGRKEFRPSPMSALTLPGKPQATLATDPATLANAAISTLEVDKQVVQPIPVDGDAGVFATVARLQRLGLEPRITPPAPITVPAPPGAEGTAPPPLVVGRKGTWAVTAISLPQADALIEQTQSTSWRIRMLRIEGMASSRVRVSLEGDYVLAP